MNKQIEEMALDLAKSIAWDEDVIPTVDCYRTALSLFGKNYRKSTDVAREIFDTLHKEIVDAIKHNMAVREERAQKHGVNPYDDPICVACTARNFALDGIDCFIASQRKKYESEAADGHLGG